MELFEIAKRAGIVPDLMGFLPHAADGLADMPRRFKKDQERIRWFMRACFAKAAEHRAKSALLLQLGDVERAEAEIEMAESIEEGASSHGMEYMSSILDAPKKASLARILGLEKWDPTFHQREKSRELADRWDLDPKLREALG